MSELCNITIDDRSLRVPAGDKVLWAALDNEIYIPHFCAVKGKARPEASCRLCFVEVDGLSSPRTACTLPAREGLVVRTRSEKVDRLVQTAFDLILSDHRLDCRNCPAHRACALQELARRRGLKLKKGRFRPLPEVRALDDSQEEFALDRSRCVLCGQCVRADREEARVGAIGFAGRGIERQVTTFHNIPLADSICTKCLLCVEACPVGALYHKG